MKKEEIYVVIDSEEKRLRALDILERAGEEVYSGSVLKEKARTDFKYLEHGENYKNWLMSSRVSNKNEITLDQLEQLLIPMSELDQLKQQAEALGYELVEKKREIKVGDFGAFSGKHSSVLILDFLQAVKNGEFICNDDITWKNFRHLTEEEKQNIQNNW